MGEIYTQASHVVVWLGEAHEFFKIYSSLRWTAIALKEAVTRVPGFVLPGFTYDLSGYKKGTTARWNWRPDALELCLQSNSPRWTDRAWIVQEFALAQSVSISFGADEGLISFDFQPEQFGDMVTRHPQRYGNYPHCRDFVEKYVNLNAMKKLAQEGRFTLSEAFHMLVRSHATDPRDKVYGFLGLLNENEAEYLDVDYNLTCAQVYAKATFASIAANDDFTILETCMYWKGDSPPVQLPTWTVDFSDRAEPATRAPDYEGFDSHRNMSMRRMNDDLLGLRERMCRAFQPNTRPSLSSDSLVLNTLGLRIGQVTHAVPISSLSPTGLRNEFSAFLQSTWRSMAVPESRVAEGIADFINATNTQHFQSEWSANESSQLTSSGRNALMLLEITLDCWNNVVSDRVRFLLEVAIYARYCSVCHSSVEGKIWDRVHYEKEEESNPDQDVVSFYYKTNCEAIESGNFTLSWLKARKTSLFCIGPAGLLSDHWIVHFRCARMPFAISQVDNHWTLVRAVYVHDLIESGEHEPGPVDGRRGSMLFSKSTAEGYMSVNPVNWLQQVTSITIMWKNVKLASSNLTFEAAYGQQAQPQTQTKGSWFARVSHRASHIPNRPLTLNSRETLPLRSAGYRSHEQLPGIQKTISHPSSPNFNSFNPASPAETEFGTTPIDASFGDRIEASPPQRPPPERPPLTAPLLSVRSRSGTAVQIERAPRTHDSKMDKYAKQVGDSMYDSDGEADDEFERSEVGVVSPTVPEHFDDDLSDHPSESESDDGFVDGEDTPTTQGWADREGRSPIGKITQWTEQQVADYIASLSPGLKQYSQAFVDEKVDGLALVSLQHDELRELGVNSVGHRLTILKAVYEQKIRSGVKVEEGDYVPPSAEGDKSELSATQDDIARVIDSIRLRDQRILATEAELRQLKQDLDRISEENKKLREEALPIMRLVKDQRTPLPDPAGGTIPSPREPEAFKQPENPAPAQSKGSSLSRKFSTKKLFLGGAPKQPSPTHPPQTHTPQPREVRDDGGTHLEASAAAVAASSHLTASMTSQASPNSVHGQQLSPTSPAYSIQAPSSGGSYHHAPSSTQRSFPRDAPSSARHDLRNYGHTSDSRDTGTGYSTNSQWSQASTVVTDSPASARTQDRRRNQAPTPSPREDDGASTRDRADRDNPQVEIFKSFRVSIEDPCSVVLPVALKRYNITDDWRQYALYIVHGDQERCLGLEEKPLLLFKQLDKEGRKPMFMLRRHAAPQEGWSSSTTTGTAHHQEGSTKPIPGGVI